MDCNGIEPPYFVPGYKKVPFFYKIADMRRSSKKTPSSAKYVTKVRPPSVPECPPGSVISTELGAGSTELGADCHPIEKTWSLPGAGQDDGNMQNSPLMGSLREKEGQHPVLGVYYFHIS